MSIEQEALCGHVLDNKCLRVVVLDKCHVLGKTNGLECLRKSVHTEYKVKSINRINYK